MLITEQDLPFPPRLLVISSTSPQRRVNIPFPSTVRFSSPCLCLDDTLFQAVKSFGKHFSFGQASLCVFACASIWTLLSRTISFLQNAHSDVGLGALTGRPLALTGARVPAASAFLCSRATRSFFEIGMVEEGVVERSVCLL